MDITFRIVREGKLMSEHTFNEAEVYEDFLEETAHTLAREMGGSVAVHGKAWDCDDDGPYLREWWDFSYVCADGSTVLRLSPYSLVEMGQVYIPPMMFPQYGGVS